MVKMLVSGPLDRKSRNVRYKYHQHFRKPLPAFGLWIRVGPSHVSCHRASTGQSTGLNTGQQTGLDIYIMLTSN